MKNNNKKIDNIIKRFKEEFDLEIKIGVELEFYIIGDYAEFLEPLIEYIKRDLQLEIKEEKGYQQYEIIFSFTSDINGLIQKIKDTKNVICSFNSQLMQRFSNQQQTFKLNKHISFAAKPFVDQPGSSMHINVSAHKNNQNIFIKNNNVESETLLYSIGGLCKHMVQDLQYFLPNYSSKERINAHSIETPSTVSWGKNNRSAAIRIPTTDPLHYRLEHRVPSADADPEKVISAILYAIYDGICHKIEPPQITYGIAHDPQYTLIKLL